MSKNAIVYRMHTDEHICPFGLKAKALLEREGYRVDDRILHSREETEQFKEQYGVKTTPQIFLGDQRVGGYDDLQAHLGKDSADTEGVTYTPVIAIFAVTGLLAAGLCWRFFGTVMRVEWVEWFVSLSMAVLAIQKLRDLDAFSNQFITYDLLGMRFVRYAYVYPFAEAGASVLMLSGALSMVAAPVALLIGGVGGISVFKAVYIDKRELRCACVGGDSRVPLGFVSLSENIGMFGMGAWLLVKALLCYWGVGDGSDTRFAKLVFSGHPAALRYDALWHWWLGPSRMRSGRRSWCTSWAPAASLAAEWAVEASDRGGA